MFDITLIQEWPQVPDKSQPDLITYVKLEAACEESLPEMVLLKLSMSNSGARGTICGHVLRYFVSETPENRFFHVGSGIDAFCERINYAAKAINGFSIAHSHKLSHKPDLLIKHVPPEMN